MYLCTLIVSDKRNKIMEKIIDENKQGSSLELALKPENTKKLFIESMVNYLDYKFFFRDNDLVQVRKENHRA